jgi:fumarate hydratase class II
MSNVRIQTDGRRKVEVPAKLWRAAQTQRSLEHYRKKIAEYVNRSLMLATPLAPLIGFDRPPRSRTMRQTATSRSRKPPCSSGSSKSRHSIGSSKRPRW